VDIIESRQLIYQKVVKYFPLFTEKLSICSLPGLAVFLISAGFIINKRLKLAKRPGKVNGSLTLLLSIIYCLTSCLYDEK